MFEVLILVWSSFCIPVAPSSMLFMCLLLLRVVFNFGCLPLINEVLAGVALARLEVFKCVCTHDVCLNFGWASWIKEVHACTVTEIKYASTTQSLSVYHFA